MREALLNLLEKLIEVHSPPGQETEIDEIIQREFQLAHAPEIETDGAGNIYAHVLGDGPTVMVAAHKDEIGFIVNSIRDDGRLTVERIGGSYPWKYGEGPVDVLAANGDTLRAILSAGSIHTQQGRAADLRDKAALLWRDVTLFTGKTPSELAAMGIGIGARGVVARERKRLERLDDFIASYALDDRMGLVALIYALRQAIEQGPRSLDLWFVATTGEEIGLIGALYAARQLQPEICIALDTSPVVPELPLSVDARPVIWYKERTYHDKTACDTLVRLSDELGFGSQQAIYNAAASDAGGIKALGLAARTVAFGFARDNSHGYEIAHADSLWNVTRLLNAYLDHLSSQS